MCRKSRRNYTRRIHRHIKRLAAPKHGCHRAQRAGAVSAGEICHRNGQQQERQTKIGGITPACSISVAGANYRPTSFCCPSDAWDIAPTAALGALDKNDKRDNGNNHNHQRQNDECRQRPLTSHSSVPANAPGNSATIPAKIISDMPLPTPRAVTCSPSHIKNTVPPKRNHGAGAEKAPGSTTTPSAPSSPTAIP